MMSRLSLLLVLCLAPLLVHSLKCLECGTYQCTPPAEKCKYGEVTDICSCCPACAKGVGEECGGPWSMSGKCGKDLECVKPPPRDEYDGYNSKGVCREKVADTSSDKTTPSDQGLGSR